MTELIETVCLKLPGTTQDIKWDRLCYLVGEKIYCMAAMEPPFKVIFKVPKEVFDELTARPDIFQAPHFARGQWVSVQAPETLSAAEWKYYLEQSYRLVLAKLPKKLQQEILGRDLDFS